MYYVLAFWVGLIVGGICMYLFVMDRFRKIKERERVADWQAKQAKDAKDVVDGREIEVNRRLAELEQRQEGFDKRLELESEGFNRQLKLRGEEFNRQLDVRREEFERRIISYKELQEENTLLKRDLQNIDVNLRKLEIDGELREQKQKELDERGTQLAKRYLGETVKQVISSMGPNNFSANKQRLLDAIAKCREIGFEITTEVEGKLLIDLRREFEHAVRTAFAKEEQARIKARIREEEKLRREVDRELQQLDRERAAIKAALDKALAEAQGQHTAEVERLQARLTEAEEKSRRAVSMAEQTKAGHVYVLSNVGTFGEGVFKVGMTRRLDPMERVSELGSASVPFPFDVHAMISCDNAPSLEAALHRALSKRRINRARPRKEFFRSSIDEIRQIVLENHGEVEYVVDPEALEYHQSLTMSDEDAEYIESVYETAEKESNKLTGEDVE
jgi:hypothetical protein